MVAMVAMSIAGLGRHLRFFKNFILRKTVANFSEISRKHVFAALNKNVSKNRV